LAKTVSDGCNAVKSAALFNSLLGPKEKKKGAALIGDIYGRKKGQAQSPWCFCQPSKDLYVVDRNPIEPVFSSFSVPSSSGTSLLP